MKQRILCVSMCAAAWAAAASVTMIGSMALGQDVEAREKLMGAWQPQEAGAAQPVWTLQQTATGLSIVSSQGPKKIVEFICDFGKECDGRDAGKKVKVTLYFNGPKLVVIETKGDEVMKRRFGFGQAADVMELEMMPMAPAGPTQTVHFTRMQTASTTKP